MEYKDTINGELLHEMLLNGFASLSRNDNYLNKLNVFPVSDGDTGTNMSVTFKRGIATLNGGEVSFNSVMLVFTKGAMLGSRGNSGFLLSQYFSGLHEHTKSMESVTINDLCGALQHAYKVAHRAVIQPVEGTMLTVMREGIDRTLPKVNRISTVREFFDVLVEEMFLCVQETVRQLDVLHDNNVVDSGALGLYLIFDGMRRVLHGDSVHFDCEQSDLLPKRVYAQSLKVSFFRYCTEFVLRMREVKSEDYFIRLLTGRGDSIVVAANESLLKVHIHTNDPEGIMEKFSGYGEFAVKKVDDLFQTSEFERLKSRKHKGFAIVAFTSGEGNAAIFEQLGADVAFNVPLDHHPSEEELKALLADFLKENVIIFADNNKETRERLKTMKWYSYPNMCVSESDCLAKTFFELSSMVFSEEFKNVVKYLEKMKNQRIFQKGVYTETVDGRIQYSGYRKNKVVACYELAELLNIIASNEDLSPYSTVVIFGGKGCRQEDIDTMNAHFEQNDDIEFTFLDGRQQGCDFIIGAH